MKKYLNDIFGISVKIEEWDENNQTGKIFRKTVETLIERVSPDLITLSGDLSYADDFASYKKFADYFDSFQIPWTCIFGNPSFLKNATHHLETATV